MNKEIHLNQCSKEELIWVINYLKKIYGDFHIRRALNELDIKKETERIEEAERQAVLAHQKRMEYLALLKPYDGQPIISVPTEIINRAEQALKEARAADRKYNKLISNKG